MQSSDTTDRVQVLVAAGSRHGATMEIAQRIGSTLGDHGLSVVVRDARDVTDLGKVDAVVLGSAVYAGHWVKEAKRVADLIAAQEQKPVTWLFSSGPIGDPPEPDDQPVDAAAVIAATEARDHRILSGKIDRSQLSFAEKAIVVAVRAAEGDFRDWSEIEAWAEEIALSLSRTPSASTQTPRKSGERNAQ